MPSYTNTAIGTHCYCCEIYTNDPANDLAKFTSVAKGTDSISFTEAGLVDPKVPGLDASSPGDASRVCFSDLPKHLFQSSLCDLFI